LSLEGLLSADRSVEELLLASDALRSVVFGAVLPDLLVSSCLLDGLLSADRLVEEPLEASVARSVVLGEVLPGLFASSRLILLEPEDLSDRDSAFELPLDLSASLSPLVLSEALFS
jgi:hypothetical protein